MVQPRSMLTTTFPRIYTFNKLLLLNDIIYHRSDNKAVPSSEAYEGNPRRQNWKKKISGWEILLEWYNKTLPHSWVPMKDFKESYIVQVTKHANDNGLTIYTEFSLWFTYTLNKQANTRSIVCWKAPITSERLLILMHRKVL